MTPTSGKGLRERARMSVEETLKVALVPAKYDVPISSYMELAWLDGYAQAMRDVMVGGWRR